MARGRRGAGTGLTILILGIAVGRLVVGNLIANKPEPPEQGGSRMSSRRRIIVGVVAVVFLTVIGVAVAAVGFMQRNDPERFERNIQAHYKYGSYGSEDRTGLPAALWVVLPDVFPDLLPDRPGEGYEKFGWIFEDDPEYESRYRRPIGTSLRASPIDLVGLNCAMCHTGTVRYEPDGERHVYLGMPAHQFDLQAYIRFLFSIVEDRRFNAGNLISAMEANGEKFSWLEEQFWRRFVIPTVKRDTQALAEDFSWFDERPDNGPGRIDTFNPYRTFWNAHPEFPAEFDLSLEAAGVGTADFPSVWLQGPREQREMELHWDGNNSSVFERNRSAAIGSGASEASLENDQLNRIADWIDGLAPPPIPFEMVDWSRVEEGEQVWLASCAECHAFDGAQVGQIIPIEDIGTDRERLDSFDDELASFQNRLGFGRDWALSNFKSTDGYANTPLDGIWLRAPYLHNGSVPTLRDLLEPPQDRPDVFWRGYDLFDPVDVGFVSQGSDAERHGFRFDTSLQGNGNGGHTYGVELSQDQKDALLEYLKTL